MSKNPDSNGEGLLQRCKRGCAFLLRFLRHPIRMGAPLPCNKDIANAICDELKEVNAHTVVELGAGVGPLTEGILKALPPDGKLLCIEREESFCRKLEDRFGDRIKLVRGNALELGEIIEGTEWEEPDAIVCSVPLIIDESEALLHAIHENLPPDSLYLQVANFRKPVEAMFKVKKSYFFPTNIPPERLHAAVHYPESQESNPSEEKEDLAQTPKA